MEGYIVYIRHLYSAANITLR